MIYNFGAGPGMLPAPVLEQIKADLPVWQNGMSVLEVSHRSSMFEELADRLKNNLRSLLQIPAHYEILLFQGGARAQFAMVPMNLLGPKRVANHVITGLWSHLAQQDACDYGQLDIVASSADINYTKIPAPETWQLTEHASYLHYTDNESVQGVEYPFIPDVGLPLVADMTSNILSRPFDLSRFAVVYASAQKNLGVAGLTIVILNPQYLQNNVINRPLLYDYKVAIENNSMFNTPCIFAWYVTDLILQWLLKQGGLTAIAAKNQRNAEKLYNCIDNSAIYKNNIDKSYRSRMSVPFTLPDKILEAKFLTAAEMQGLLQLKGHKATGGMRASLYNAMPEDGVQALVNFMHDFEKRC